MRRWRPILIVAALLAAQLIVAGTTAQAGNTPTNGSWILGPGCPQRNPTHVDWDTHDVWSSAGGDWTGPNVYGGSGNNCSGSSRYHVDGKTVTAVFRWHLEVDADSAISCHIWTYIPSQSATDQHAHYNFYADDGLSGLITIAPSHTIDQLPISGWQDMGSVNVPADTYLLTVILDNQDVQNPGGLAGAGDMAFSCTPTPVLNSTEARHDFINRIHTIPGNVQYNMLDDANNTMDTMKVLQPRGGVGGYPYVAVYHSGHPLTVHLAGSTDLINWHYLVDLDQNASQSYMAQEGDGGFVLADESIHTDGATSSLNFIHFANSNALLNGAGDRQFLTPLSLGTPQCNEGTPDIHGINNNGSTLSVGLHYNSNCSQLDQEAFGTLSNFSTQSANWTATEDTVRDAAVNAAGYDGKHGARDDIVWRGYRFSLQEAQINRVGNNLDDNTRWRLVLYDYSNHQAFDASVALSVACQANPRVTLLTDPNGSLVLAVTIFIFPPSQMGCAVGSMRDVLYLASAQ